MIRFNQGQSLTEYSLVIGLVALASIAGVAVLARNIQQNMLLTTSQNVSPTINNPQTISKNLSAPNLFLSPGKGNSQNTTGLSLPTEELCINGICAHFPIVDQTNDIIDLSAGNGGDRIYQYVTTLTQMADSIEQQTNDGVLADMIRKLANKGHGIGDATKRMMKLGHMQNGVLTLNQNWSERGALQSEYHHFIFAEKKLQDYLNKHPDILSSQVQGVLMQQKEQIKNYYKTGSIASSNGAGDVTFQKVRLIHQSSNTICGQQDQTTCMRPIQTQETAGNP